MFKFFSLKRSAERRAEAAKQRTPMETIVRDARLRSEEGCSDLSFSEIRDGMLYHHEMHARNLNTFFEMLTNAFAKEGLPTALEQSKNIVKHDGYGSRSYTFTFAWKTKDGREVLLQITHTDSMVPMVIPYDYPTEAEMAPNPHIVGPKFRMAMTTPDGGHYHVEKMLPFTEPNGLEDFFPKWFRDAVHSAINA